jgi:hypothetical protein
LGIALGKADHEEAPVVRIFIVGINWNDWSSSIATDGRHHVVRALSWNRPLSVSSPTRMWRRAPGARAMGSMAIRRRNKRFRTAL